MKKRLLKKLVGLHLITPAGIWQLAVSLMGEGITLMALMKFAAHYYPQRCALVAEGRRYTYEELYQEARVLAGLLYHHYQLNKFTHARVGILCRNHAMVALLLPALSRLGVAIKLFNTDIATDKIGGVVQENGIGLLVCEEEFKEKRPEDGWPCNIATVEELEHALWQSDTSQRLPRIRRGGEISVFTSGSSGKYKEASRGTSVFQFLPPLFALLEDIGIDERDSMLLPLPLFHGFGLAALVISFLMGKKVCLMRKFDVDKALQMISEEKIETLSLVPAMLARLWQNQGTRSRLNSIKCIICGGDRLDKKWVDTTYEQLGPVLFNLYGTSEAGFFMLATPEDLMRYEKVTIGKPVRGVKCKVNDADESGVGTLWVRSGWAMSSRRKMWQETGDLVSCNADGYFFYCGRADNMVVCGGENVYPSHVEDVINGHPEILASMVYAAPDLQFGTVLHAKVELLPDSVLSVEQLKAWLHPRLSRHEMPHRIFIAPMGMSGIGKWKGAKN